MTLPSLLPGTLEGVQSHDGAAVRDRTPLRVTTPAGQWWYAVSCALSPGVRGADGALAQATRFVLDLEVIHGRIGVGWTAPDGESFVIERTTGDASARIVLTVPAGVPLGRLVIRNVSDQGPSEFVVRGVNVEALSEGAIRYPVSVDRRELIAEHAPEGGDTTTFDTRQADAINLARLGWLTAANLPVDGTRVLDAGAGVGHFIDHYRRRGCTVVAVDGRDENIAELRRRHPDVEAHVADLQTIEPSALGRFEVIHCFGLLYHLDSPVAALRRLHAMCRRCLILETMVCDAAAPVAILADETQAFSQALAGLGSRPSPSFVTMALNRVGFRYVYAAGPVPRHEDFEFTWMDNLDVERDGHPLRCVFVASQEPLDCPMLVPLIE